MANGDNKALFKPHFDLAPPEQNHARQDRARPFGQAAIKIPFPAMLPDAGIEKMAETPWNRNPKYHDAAGDEVAVTKFFS
jgi:hypothetical protein